MLSVDKALQPRGSEKGSFPTESAAAYLILLHPGMSQILGVVADMLAAGLRELSYTAEIANALPTNLDHKIIVLGANLFNESELSTLPPESIIFNVENSSSSFITPSYIRLLRNFTVWDYNKTNAEMIEFIIARPVYYLKMFYAVELARIPDLETKDIDVLFFGSFNARRSAVLDDLRQRGLTVKAVFGVFGPELDELISRSKVVINIHFYPNGRSEIIRIFDLLANGRTVVSELNPDETVDDDLKDALIGAPYEQLADVTEALVRDPDRCARVAASGNAIIKSRRGGAILRDAITWSEEVQRIPGHAVIGSGKSYDPALFNLDIEDRWHPDIVADIADRELFTKNFSSRRFGTVRLRRGQFDSITASHVLEHIPDLVTAMTNCLALLCEGGTMRVAVPYDLSYGAWQDPTHVHAFNEKSWLYYCEWHWYLGWGETRFDLIEQKFRYSSIGDTLAAKGLPEAEILRTPRAVDEMHVVLRKRNLTDEERRFGRAMRGDSRDAV